MDQRPETVSYIEENISAKLVAIGFREDFMNLTPREREGKNK